MSDGGTGEKTEEPTPERLRKLRKDGNVPKSQDVTQSIAFLVVFTVLAGTFGFLGGGIMELFHDGLKLMSRIDGETSTTVSTAMLANAVTTLFLVTAPVLVAAFVTGVVLNVAQVGFMFTTKPITPDINKVNPVNGLKNLFNMKKVVELLKTVAKFVVVSYLSYAALRSALREVVLVVRSDVPMAMRIIGSIVWDFCIEIGMVFIAIAAADFFYQRARYKKDNMMSKYDIKQEYKQSEGDPQMKADRKRLFQEILNSPADIKGAKAVVTNPEHIAVAIAYDDEGEGGGGAPKVLAKGQRLWAEKIKEAARQYGIPIVRNVPLAHALDKLEIGEEIPEDLYEAVAEVLSFVYELAEKQNRR